MTSLATCLATASRRFFLTGLFVTSALVAADAQLPRLEREIERVSKIAGGVVGASAVHLETGRKVSFHGDEPGLAHQAAMPDVPPPEELPKKQPPCV